MADEYNPPNGDPVLRMDVPPEDQSRCREAPRGRYGPSGNRGADADPGPPAEGPEVPPVSEQIEAGLQEAVAFFEGKTAAKVTAHNLVTGSVYEYEGDYPGLERALREAQQREAEVRGIVRSELALLEPEPERLNLKDLAFVAGASAIGFLAVWAAVGAARHVFGRRP